MAQPHMTPAQLRRIRRALQLSQPKLADLLGVHESTVYRWEAGERPISPLAAQLLRRMRRDVTTQGAA